MWRILARVNRFILPSFSKQQLDLSKATTLQKGIIGWRYFITIRALDEEKK